MKNFLNILLFLIFIMTELLSASENSEATSLNLTVGACHLNLDKIGIGEKGKGDPYIVIYKNKKAMYDSRTKHKNGTGPDFVFNDSLSFDIRKGDTVKIVLGDADVLLDDILISQESSDFNSIRQMLNGRHEKDGSWYQCKLNYTPGKYHVQLISSSMVKDDLDETIMSAGGIQIDNPDHLVCVWQNSKEIFSTGKKGENCGPQKKWDDQSFDIQWKPGDKIEIGFYERDPLQNDKIFFVTDSTDNSIGIFMDTLSGGKSNSSNVIFSLKGPLEN
jgi:hypothetical protein